MGVKRGREHGGSDGAQVEYEKLRNDRLRENQKRMEELGILSLSQSLSGTKRPPRSSPVTPRVILPAGPARRSSRLSGGIAISYAENTGRGKRDSEGKDKKAGRRASEAGTGGFQPEIYTEEHEKLLGESKAEWELFVDGYDGKGSRIYDPSGGKTCHQCRQKTMGRRTSCNSCQALRGQFCGDCLYMRYGENVMEANENESWECPPCRGICNCSFCRLKRGWTPTGSLYRRIKSLGYKSVAHYLIHTRRGDDEGEGDEKVTPSGVDINVKVASKAEPLDEAPKAEPLEEAPKAEPLEESPVSKMRIEEAVLTVKQEIATSETDDKNALLNLISAKAEVQTTLLTAGFRARRAVSAKAKDGAEKAVKEANVAEVEVADGQVERDEQKKRRGRPRKNPPSGKASFYGSAPRTRTQAQPESEVLILVLDSDSESASDGERKQPATIARRLLRRRVS